jgi:xylulokinase
VIEGVACGFRDCLEALRASGTMIEHALVTGGGTRSPYVMDVLATVLGIRLVLPEHGEYGAAYGAARLGRLAASGENPSIICQPPPIARIVEPDVRQASSIAERYARYRRLYPALKECTA